MLEKNLPIIRPACESDISIIGNIYWKAVTRKSEPRYTENIQKNKDKCLLNYQCHMEEMLQKEDTHIFVADIPKEKKGSKTQAYIMFSLNQGSDFVYIDDLYNASTTHRLGPHLMNEAIGMAQENKIGKLKLCAVRGAEKAYHEMGFESTVRDSITCIMVRPTTEPIYIDAASTIKTEKMKAFAPQMR